MSGPEGDQPRGFWDVDEVQPPHRLVFRDGFANEDGTPNSELPMTTVRVTIEEIGRGKSRMSIASEFPTVEAMEQLAAMWGLEQTVGQIDAILRLAVDRPAHDVPPGAVTQCAEDAVAVDGDLH